VKDDMLYLIHISECIGRIESYLTGVTKEVFMSTTLLQDAVLRNLQTMAESTQRISDALKSRHQDIDWYRISGFRNILVHDYLGVDIERVWNILEKDLLELKNAITRLREGA